MKFKLILLLIFNILLIGAIAQQNLTNSTLSTLFTTSTTENAILETTTTTTTNHSNNLLVELNQPNIKSKLFKPNNSTRTFSLTSFKSTTTTSTTSTTSTSKTALTKRLEILEAFIIDFKLIDIIYNKKSSIFIIDYLIQTNLSSINQFIRQNSQSNRNNNVTYQIGNSGGVYAAIDLKCANKFNQTWSKQINGIFINTPIYNSKIFINTRSQQQPPYHGSLIKCTSLVYNSLNFNNQNVTQSINLLIEPLPVQNFRTISSNETSLEFKWQFPDFNQIDFLELQCNDENNNILNNTIPQQHVETRLSGILPGSFYNCTLTAKRIEGEISKFASSQTIQAQTKLDQVKLLTNISYHIFDDFTSFEFELEEPSGLFDFIVIQLKQNQDFIQIKNFTKLNFQKIVKLDKEIMFSKLKYGQKYELTAQTFRQNFQTKKVKLSNEFVFRPKISENRDKFDIFVESSNQLKLNFSQLSQNEQYIIELFYLNDKEPFDSFIISNSSSLILNLTEIDSATFLISLKKCTTFLIQSKCDVKSIESFVRTFSLNEIHLLYDLNIFKKNNSIIRFANKTSLILKWKLNTTNPKDLSGFRLMEFNTKSNKQKEHMIKFNNSNIFEIEIDNLNFNTKYKFSINAVSLNSKFEWPKLEFKQIKTESTVPSNDKIETQFIHSLLKSSNSINLNIIQPRIDQTNGEISDMFLYLVKLKSSASNFTTHYYQNETMILTNFKFDLTRTYRDQDYLSNLVDSSLECSNYTYSNILEPCLIKRYQTNDIDLNSEKLILIGNDFDEFNLTNQTFSYENLTFNYLEPNSLYQLFYVFKIQDEEQNFIYFSSLPTEPILTNKKLISQTISSLISRDGMAMWLIVMISIVSSLILILIIFATIALLVRYRPGINKFHKATHIMTATQPNQNTSKLGIFNNIASASSKNDFDFYMGGMSSDFLIPGEFNRLQMTNIWFLKHSNGDLIFDEEYRHLPDFRHEKSTKASDDFKNEIKNRFLDIKAYDDSRVVLDVPNQQQFNINSSSSQNSVDISMSTSTTSSSNNSTTLELTNCGNVVTDYINANFVQGYSHDKKFIATQGPKKETLVDFWRMIYQYRITSIVMLTKLVEKGVERCTQYWPDKLNITEQYGDYEVTMKDQQKCGDYIKRTFDLVLVNNQNHHANSNNLHSTPGSMSMKRFNILNVTQYYYPEWPDKDTPSTDPISILHLIRDVNQNCLPYQYPIVVHCSAGVGRTGTYITLDAMMEKIDRESKIDIFGFISKIRERRQYLVQTSKQYVFIHEALYEYCLYGFTDIEITNLEQHYNKYLKEISPVNSQGTVVNTSINKKTRLQIEFEKLSNARLNMQAREAFSNDNKNRNRYLNTICYDENRVRLSTLNGSSYINATKIKGYELLNELIITQDPMANTKFEFYKMIVEYECNCIVSLNKDFEMEAESIYWPTLENPMLMSEVDDLKYVIELVKNNEHISNSNRFLFIRQEFDITEYKYSSSSKMRVVHYILNESWLENTLPPNRRAFIDLVCQAQKTASNLENSRIIVHAHGGGSNCSLFCALLILLNQYKNDQRIDVCRTVKTLIQQRPEMIQTFEQYEYLYQCLLDFIEIFGISASNSSTNQTTVSLNGSFNDSSIYKSRR